MAKQYGLVIDTYACSGCHTCEMACKIEHSLPNGVWWNRVLTDGGAGPDTYRGEYGAGYLRYRPMACQHCANPACVEVCPTGATFKDKETGIVCQDTEVCIGCQSCIGACPYPGVRTYVDEEPAYATSVVLGDTEVPAHKAVTVEKCTLCWERVNRGEEPACVASCPAYARYFGDLNDPESEVSKLIAEREYEQVSPEAGTVPSVYYLL